MAIEISQTILILVPNLLKHLPYGHRTHGFVWLIMYFFHNLNWI